MILKYYYWYFKAAIPPRICNDLIRYGTPMLKEKRLGLVGGIRSAKEKDKTNKPLTKKEIKWLKKKRDSYVTFINDRWIYKGILNGVGQKTVSLLNIKKDSIMDGMQMVLLNLFKKKVL